MGQEQQVGPGRQAMGSIVVMSTCPQDMNPINGAACTPTEVHFAVLDFAGLE